MVQDARRFIYSSDSKMPTFVWKVEGNVVNSEGSWLGGCKKFKHNLPFTPMLMGVWSNSSDFRPSSNIGEGSYIQSSGSGFIAFADSTYVYVKGIVTNDTPQTFYYRLYSYTPPDYDGDMTPLTDISTFHFDTDYNYLQIAKEGKIVPNGVKYHEVEHNLGYIPLYKIWRTVNVDFWEQGQGVVSKRGLCPTVSYVYPDETPSMWDVADTEKLYINWHENRSIDSNDFAYYQVYSNEA